MIRRQLVTALRVTVCLIVICGVVYPLVVFGVGRLAFAGRADGSFVSANGRVVGSSLIGQSFSDASGRPLARYFQPRPSAAGHGYDASSSGGSNLGPSNPDLITAVADRVAAYRDFDSLAPGAPVPVDAVTASGSGLDPDISEANALDQAGRVARARGLMPAAVVALVHTQLRNRAWGVLGQNTVNVLDLNMALDHLGGAG